MIKKSLWTTLSSFAFAFNSFLSNKFFSLFFGPEGVTILAHFQNAIAIFTTIPSDGTNRAIAQKIANPALKQSEYNQYISAALLANLISFFACIVFFACSYFSYKNDFPVDLFSFNYLIIIILGTFLHILALMVANLLLTSMLVKAYSIFSVINNIVGISLVYFGLKMSLVWGLVFVAISPCFVLFFMLIYYYKQRKSQVQNFRFSFTQPAFKLINMFIITALSVAVFGRIVDFFVRDYVINSFSSYETGLWQSVVKISDGYTTVFNAALGMLIFVKISSVLDNQKALKRFITQSIIIVFTLAFFGLTTLWFLGEYALTIFYNSEFIIAQKFMFYQFLGDLFKFPSFILAFLMLSQLKIKTYVFLQALSACIYCFCIYFFAKTGVIENLPLAHAIRFGLYFLFLILIYRKLFLSSDKIKNSLKSL